MCVHMECARSVRKVAGLFLLFTKYLFLLTTLIMIQDNDNYAYVNDTITSIVKRGELIWTSRFS